MPHNHQSSIAFIKNIAVKVIFLIALTACGLESHDNANAPFDPANFALSNCPISSSSVSRTAEYQNSSGLDAICASYAYDAGYSGEGQTVSLLDTPVFNDHAEFIDDNNQSAFINVGSASCSQTCSDNETYHGTHVAGIIGARKNTLTGSDAYKNTHGVAYNANIKPVAIFDEEGVDNTNTQSLAIAIRQGSGATIIAMNNSWGQEAIACVNYAGRDYYYPSPVRQNFIDDRCESINIPISNSELNAWRNAIDSGTIIVFANGNHGLNSANGRVGLYNSAEFERTAAPDYVVNASSLFGASNADIPSYEASYPEYDSALKGKWISVIAVDSSNNITSFSNGCGATKDYCIAAPGYSIYGPLEAPNEWGYYSGTSQAAPHVSGAIALLKEAYPSMSSEEIVSLILDSATDLGAKGTDNVYGRGMLNLRAAIQPIGELNAVTTNNQSLDVLMDDTSLTLAGHFGTQIHEVEIGMRDNYNRTFIASPTKFDRVPITSSLDDYMQNFTNSDQTETYALTPQTSLNYQSDENQTWMHLVYDYGNATASIAFYDNLQPKLLPQILIGDESYAPILRAFAIRPAGEDIAQMNVSHQLNSRVTLSSYAAKGIYDTGHDFNELGTDINYKTDRLTLNIGMGHLREYQQFLGTESTGAYALDGASLSQFSDIHISHKLHKNSRFSLFAHYALYETKVDMRYQQFAEIQDLQADHSAIGITGADIISEDDNITISFNTALGVTDGALVQHTVLGYTDDGEYNNVSNRYDLAVENRHQQFVMTYQGKLQNRGERNIPLFSQNRFFTSITYDNHYQHQQGLTQISIISGISAEF